MRRKPKTRWDLDQGDNRLRQDGSRCAMWGVIRDRSPGASPLRSAHPGRGVRTSWRRSPAHIHTLNLGQRRRRFANPARQQERAHKGPITIAKSTSQVLPRTSGTHRSDLRACSASAMFGECGVSLPPLRRQTFGEAYPMGKDHLVRLAELTTRRESAQRLVTALETLRREALLSSPLLDRRPAADPIRT